MRGKTSSKKSPGLFLFFLLLLTLAACQSQEQELAFETVAKSALWDFGATYREKAPALLVITRPDEIDDPVQTVLTSDPKLADQLRTLDYDHIFAVLVLHGVTSSGHSITVQKITRQGNQVTLWSQFAAPSPETIVGPAVTSPYHLIAVSKEGSWGEEIRFVVMDNDQPVAEGSHFVP